MSEAKVQYFLVEYYKKLYFHLSQL